MKVRLIIHASAGARSQSELVLINIYMKVCSTVIKIQTIFSENISKQKGEFVLFRE